MTINIVIERLVLDGLPLTARERDRMVSGLQAELVRLFEREGVPGSVSSDHMAPSFSAGPVHAATPLEPTALGRDVARAVHGAFEPSRAWPQTHPPAGPLNPGA
jgi:hypothetical protein